MCRTRDRAGSLVVRCYDVAMRMSGSDYASKYAEMYDAELINVARDLHSLTESAQAALRAEFATRALTMPESAAPEQRPVWRDLVTVGRYRDLTEAEVARSVLESAGIGAEIFDENLSRMNWALTNALGGVRLQVDVADQRTAEELLQQGVPESIAFGADEEFSQPNCPTCGSLNISFEGASRKAALASLYILSLPLPAGRERWVCSNCGSRWEAPQAE